MAIAHKLDVSVHFGGAISLGNDTLVKLYVGSEVHVCKFRAKSMTLDRYDFSTDSNDFELSGYILGMSTMYSEQSEDDMAIIQDYRNPSGEAGCYLGYVFDITGRKPELKYHLEPADMIVVHPNTHDAAERELWAEYKLEVDNEADINDYWLQVVPVATIPFQPRQQVKQLPAGDNGKD
jgi:hypothetical protein